MKPLTKLVVAAAMVAFAGTAQATDLEPVVVDDDSGWYLRADAGYGFGDDDGFVAGAGIGYEWDILRADVRADFNSFTSVLGNVYFDFDMDSSFSPYIGAGAGYGWDSGDDGFAYALMAGVGFDLSDHLTLDIGYRYRDMDSGPESHEVLGGLRFEF